VTGLNCYWLGGFYWRGPKYWSKDACYPRYFEASTYRIHEGPLALAYLLVFFFLAGWSKYVFDTVLTGYDKVLVHEWDCSSFGFTGA